MVIGMPWLLPGSPSDIIAPQAPAISPPGLLPATVGETYSPPDHSVTARIQTMNGVTKAKIVDNCTAYF